MFRFRDGIDVAKSVDLSFNLPRSPVRSFLLLFDFFSASFLVFLAFVLLESPVFVVAEANWGKKEARRDGGKMIIGMELEISLKMQSVPLLPVSTQRSSAPTRLCL